MRDILGDLEEGIHLSDPDPVKRAQNQMRAPVAKRFYKDVTTAPVAEGFAVHLDGKPVRTPGKALLALPTELAAGLVGAEFDAQKETIDPVSMPVTRLANSAIDGVASNLDAVLEDVVRFAGSDLLCYRAEAPERLVARQAQAWDPVLDWAHRRLGARFVLAAGIVHVAQPPEAIEAVRRHIAGRADPFRLAALHLLPTITGSALLALAVDDGAIDAEAAWSASQVDEDWNAEQWGEDFEASARNRDRKRDLMAAVMLLAALPTRQG